MESAPANRVPTTAASIKPASWPVIDFSTFGPIEIAPLSKIQNIVAAIMLRNWTMIPHVTHHEDADITDLESYRGRLAAELGMKVTLLAFLVKAAVRALREHRKFNGSLDASGQNFVFKNYFNIGFAVDTAQGLLVPVIRHADTKSLIEIVREIVEVTNAARGKGLPFDRMSGGCFTISSLGAIGGTGFTPIINAPEVAILGVSKSAQKPVLLDNGQIGWRTVVPLSLSYDHRIVNGADAARFCVEFQQALANPQALAQP